MHFARVKDDVYFGSNRAFHVVGNSFVYDESGKLCYLINGVWYFAPDGTGTYYQAAAEQAVLEAKQREERRKIEQRKRERKSWYHNLLWGKSDVTS
jgi:hypothetical protein